MSYVVFTRNKRLYMLTYNKLNKFEFIGYLDSDFVGCQETKRSTFGYIYLLVGEATS